MKCFEDYRQGHLGYGDITNRCNEGNELGNYLPLVDLGAGRTVVTLWGFDNFRCALLDGATFECYGDKDGQTGYGVPSHRGDKANEMGGNLDVVKIGTAKNSCFYAIFNSCMCPS